MQVNGFLSYKRSNRRFWPPIGVAPLLIVWALAGCADDMGYAGTLAPVGGTCDTGTRATLQRHGSVIQFAPQDGVLTLDGTVNSAGQIVAAQQTLGMDRKPYRLSFTGQVTGDNVTGTYVTPRCRYEATLHIAQ